MHTEPRFAPEPSRRRFADGTTAMLGFVSRSINESDESNELMLSFLCGLQRLDPRRAHYEDDHEEPDGRTVLCRRRTRNCAAQSAAQEIHLSDIRAQQSQESIFASAPCRRARESPRGLIGQRDAIDPKTLVPDLNTLMEKSDEVILAGDLDRAVVVSLSGESTATYHEVMVIRSLERSASCRRHSHVWNAGRPRSVWSIRVQRFLVLGVAGREQLESLLRRALCLCPVLAAIQG